MATFFEDLLTSPINMIAAVISVIVIVLGIAYAVTSPKMLLLAVKNLRRNLVRTTLTGLAIMVLVIMITLIWTVIYFLDKSMTEKTANFKLIIMERWKV